MYQPNLLISSFTETAFKPILERFKNRLAVLIDKLLRTEASLNKIANGAKMISSIVFAPSIAQGVPPEAHAEILRKCEESSRETLIALKRSKVTAIEETLRTIRKEFENELLKHINGIADGPLKKEAFAYTERECSSINNLISSQMLAKRVQLAEVSIDQIFRSNSFRELEEVCEIRVEQTQSSGRRRRNGRVFRPGNPNLFTQKSKIRKSILRLISLGANWQLKKKGSYTTTARYWNQAIKKVASLQGVDQKILEKEAAHSWLNFVSEVETQAETLDVSNNLNNKKFKSYQSNQSRLTRKSDFARMFRLLKNNNLLVLPADKNMGLTVLDFEWYHEMVSKEVQNQRYYTEITSIPLNDVERQLRENSPNQNWTRNLENCLIPAFYGIPKLHKSPIKLRPIVPSIQTITTAPSIYCDSIFQRFLNQPEILTNSLELVQTLEEMHDISWTKNTILVTMDVDAMYTNIDISEGCDKVKTLISEISGNRILAENTMQLWKWVLENNYFVYDKKLYRQIRGTAMGTNGAPSYANLFMNYFEITKLRKFREYTSSIRLYKRYIDDIFMIWEGSTDSLMRFFGFVNSWSPSISISHDLSYRTVNFMDLTIHFDVNKKICVKPFWKPQNSHCYTHPSSFYPKSYKFGWIYGETIRLLRNSSKEEYFNGAINFFCHHLHKRGYKQEVIVEKISRVRFADRRTYVHDVTVKNTRNRVYFSNDSHRPTLYKHFHDLIERYNEKSGHDIDFTFITLKGSSILDQCRFNNRQIITQNERDDPNPMD